MISADTRSQRAKHHIWASRETGIGDLELHALQACSSNMCIEDNSNLDHCSHLHPQPGALEDTDPLPNFRHTAKKKHISQQHILLLPICTKVFNNTKEGSATFAGVSRAMCAPAQAPTDPKKSSEKLTWFWCGEAVTGTSTLFFFVKPGENTCPEVHPTWCAARGSGEATLMSRRHTHEKNFAKMASAPIFLPV
jgi:hypothetical protein